MNRVTESTILFETLACSLWAFAWVCFGLALAVPGRAQSRAGTEPVDLATIGRIRDEGFNHSHVMEYASGLFDGIGPRLTASPDFARAEAWAIDQLGRMGASHVHTETWGVEGGPNFGMGWQQVGTSVEMVAPGTATFLAQSTPWSPATAGEVEAGVVAVPELTAESEFAQWKGKLAGKVILYGTAPVINPNPPAAMQHYDQAKLDHFATYPIDGDQRDSDAMPADPGFWEGLFKRKAFLESVGRFFADEHAAAVLVAGGANGVLHDDVNYSLGWMVFRSSHRQAIPSAVIANEAFGRMSRLLAHDVPVSVRVKIETRFSGAGSGVDEAPGENVIAEIPGTDPQLKDQVVMLGGHLDSWIAGTGATDDGAGVVIALEAMRILRAVGVQPRRTIRVGLWGGEELGIYGSTAYVMSHLATLGFSTKPEEMVIPQPLRVLDKALVVKPEQAKFDAYFNADNGTGKFLGIYTEGNLAAAEVFGQWAEPIRNLGFTTISPRNTGFTDHVVFDAAGVPAFQFIQDPRDYDSRTHHTNLDTYERLSEPDLKQAAVVMAILVYDTAQRETMLPRKPLPHPELDEQRARPLEGVFPGAATTNQH